MTEVKLIDERNYFTSISTIAQAGARKLYDEIQIHGPCSGLFSFFFFQKLKV